VPEEFRVLSDNTWVLPASEQAESFLGQGVLLLSTGGDSDRAELVDLLERDIARGFRCDAAYL
jgi:hypothetical protein